MSERSFPRGSFGFKGTREPDPGNQSPDSSGRYAENHRAFGLAFAGRQQFPYSDDGPAVQFRRSATYLPDRTKAQVVRIHLWWCWVEYVGGGLSSFDVLRLLVGLLSLPSFV